MIPHSDDFLLPPHERSKPTIPQTFWQDRFKVFSQGMDQDALIDFYSKYGISHPNPYRKGDNRAHFWAMTYTAVVTRKLGAYVEKTTSGSIVHDESIIRATIWLDAHRRRRHITHTTTQEFITYTQQGTYTIYGKLFHVPSLLIAKRPK